MRSLHAKINQNMEKKVLITSGSGKIRNEDGGFKKSQEIYSQMSQPRPGTCKHQTEEYSEDP